jgi:hypothetical protein
LVEFLSQTVNNPTNTPNATMSVFLRPLNFAAIQGAPHQVPEKAIDKLPTFRETMPLVPSLTS